MSLCVLNKGYQATCEALRQPGGLNRRIYIGNLETENGRVTYETDEDGYVTELNFPEYDGLHKVIGAQYAHGSGNEMSIQAGANKFSNHQVMIRILADGPADIEFLEQLIGSNVFVIVETRGGKFIAYGLDSGLELSEGSQEFGQEAETDISYNWTLSGAEKDLPKFVKSDSEETSTIELLDSYIEEAA